MISPGMFWLRVADQMCLAFSNEQSGDHCSGQCCHPGRPIKGAEGASAPPQEIQPTDLLNVLIKDHLFFKQEAQPVIDANSFVVLFKDFNVAKKFAQSASSWPDHEPAHVPTGQKTAASSVGDPRKFSS